MRIYLLLHCLRRGVEEWALQELVVAWKCFLGSRQKVTSGVFLFIVCERHKEIRESSQQTPLNQRKISEWQNWALLPIASLLHVAHKSSDTSRSGLLHSRKLEWENEAWSSEPDYQVEKGETSHSLLQNLPTLQVSSQASTRSTGKSAGRIFFHFHLVE